jgi:hypothetical protein
MFDVAGESGRKNPRYPYDEQPEKERSPRGGVSPPRPLSLQKPLASPRDKLNDGYSDEEDDDGEEEEDSVAGAELPYFSRGAGGGKQLGFRILPAGGAAAKAAAATAQAVQRVMAAVEGKFRSRQCNVSGFIDSALAADVRNFDKVSMQFCFEFYTKFIFSCNSLCKDYML